MFAAINRIHCPAAAAEHLERAFQHAGNLENVPGFVAFQFLKNTREGEPLEYLALTTWESRAAYEAWRKSEAFSQAHGGAGGEGSVTASLDTYEVLQ